MGTSIIIPGADFSASGIRQDGLTIYRSALAVRAIKVADSSASNYGNYTEVLIGLGEYPGYTYCVDVREMEGREIKLTFCVGYASSILANGGFINNKPAWVQLRDNWGTSADYTPLSFIDVVGSITSEESNTWVTKTYTVPQGAKYLLFTSKYLAGGTAGVELVEEAES